MFKKRKNAGIEMRKWSAVPLPVAVVKVLAQQEGDVIEISVKDSLSFAVERENIVRSRARIPWPLKPRTSR